MKTNLEQSIVYENLNDNITYIRDKKIIDYNGSPNEIKLYSYTNTLDEEIIEEFNNDESNKELIRSFNHEDKKNISGSDIVKKIAITLFRKIQDKDYRNTENGDIVYKAYSDLLDKVTITQLNQNLNLIYDNNVMENCCSLLILTVDPGLTTTVEISQSFRNILALTYVPKIGISLSYNEELDIISENSKKTLEDIKNETNNEIINNNNNKGVFLKAYKIMRSTLHPNPILQSMQLAGYTGIVLYGGKYALGSLVFKSFANQLSIESPSLLDMIRESRNESQNKIVEKKSNIFGDILIKAGQWLNEFLSTK